jgi:hypothetical protein
MREFSLNSHAKKKERLGQSMEGEVECASTCRKSSNDLDLRMQVFLITSP